MGHTTGYIQLCQDQHVIFCLVALCKSYKYTFCAKLVWFVVLNFIKLCPNYQNISTLYFFVEFGYTFPKSMLPQSTFRLGSLQKQC